MGESGGKAGGGGTAGSTLLQVGITHGATTGVIHTQLVGDYNLPNILAAVAVGKHFGVPDDRIRESIEAYTPSNSRSQLIEKDGNHIILDAYNANPSSMRAAIENFSRIEGGKVLILGAMAELGPESLTEHQGIVNLIAQQLIQPLNQSYLTKIGNMWPELRDPFYDRGGRYTTAYVVWLDGSTDRVASGGGISCAAGIGGAGCMGLAWWEDDSRYDATVWDIRELQSEGTIHADVKGRSVMPAIIIPLPLISHPQAHACRDLTKQLKQFLTTPEGYGGRAVDAG